MSNYIKDALRTESISGANERLGMAIIEVEQVRQICTHIDTIVDDVKKFIFYGKKQGEQYNSLKLDFNIPEEKIRLLHSGLGMLTEASEFLVPILNSILLSTDLDKVNLKEELGDSMWYQAIACDVLGTTFELEQERNINKLRARYPEKFTEDLAINRDIDTERKILEGIKNEN